MSIYSNGDVKVYIEVKKNHKKIKIINAKDEFNELFIVYLKKLVLLHFRFEACVYFSIDISNYVYVFDKFANIFTDDQLHKNAKKFSFT